MVILDQNHVLTPLEKCQFFNFLNLFFYSLERDFFVLEYRKGHFPMLYCGKKKMEKWPYLVQNHGLTPLAKCQFFDFLNVFFYSLERCFFIVEYRKRHFAGLYCLKKICWKNCHFYQNHGLTPLKKCQFFDCLNLFFYSLKRCFFVLEYGKRRFPGLYCLKKKVEEMAIFGPKPLLKNVNFSSD